jgi:nucleotide-binding universal stress UspA family protein
MLEMKRILTPIDFSERSATAAKRAVGLAGRFGASLTFLHVVSSTTVAYPGPDGGCYPLPQAVSAETLAALQRRLECVALQAAADSRFTESIVRKGDAASEIVALARQRQIDLIVMPTHGHGPFRRFILGSVTAKVLHDSDYPVFTGAHVAETQTEEPQPYRRVACAVDLCDHSTKVATWTADFARAYEARLVLIHVVPDEPRGTAGREWRADRIRVAKGRLKELAQMIGWPAELYVEAGDVEREVPQIVTDSAAELLVIGRSVHNGLLGRLHTNAYALIRESPCTVVSV